MSVKVYFVERRLLVGDLGQVAGGVGAEKTQNRRHKSLLQNRYFIRQNRDRILDVLIAQVRCLRVRRMQRIC